MRRWIISAGLWLLMAALSVPVAMGAYSAHQNDQDVANFLGAYPFARGTKLDDCALCHPGGKQGSKNYGSCDYCHLTYGLQAPHSQPVPLNEYGKAYKTAGRTQDALKGIENVDSDGDHFLNGEEIQALFFPGDGNDYPGLTPAPAVVMNLERLLLLPSHSQFLLMNASKSEDTYARYSGVKVKDLLNYAGIRSDATQITVFAPDGFSKTFPIDAEDPQTPSGIQYDVMGPYPKGFFYGGLDFVSYAYVPWYVRDGARISDRVFMLLAFMRDGDPLARGRLVRDASNPSRLVLDGEGPYRLVPPQKIAGGPDRPQTSPAQGDGWDYDANKDHNAGSSVRSVAAIKVEPLPDGSTDFRWTEGGWNLVDKGRVVIYGAIDPETHAIKGQTVDEDGESLPDVRISFGLASLGQVGETTSGRRGNFRKALPVGEYVVIPSKPGYRFAPPSALVQLSDCGYQLEFMGVPSP
jgi:hypothetical protein